MQNLIKIKHPNILQVIHPVSDGKTTVAFDTEPVIGTLSNLLQHLKNVDNPSAFETNLTDIDVWFGCGFDGRLRLVCWIYVRGFTFCIIMRICCILIYLLRILWLQKRYFWYCCNG